MYYVKYGNGTHYGHGNVTAESLHQTHTLLQHMNITFLTRSPSLSKKKGRTRTVPILLLLIIDE